MFFIVCVCVCVQDWCYPCGRSYPGHQQREPEGEATQRGHPPPADGRGDGHPEDQETAGQWVHSIQMHVQISIQIHIYIQINI